MAKFFLSFVVLTLFLSTLTASLIDIGDGTSYNGSSESPCPYGAVRATFTDQYLITAAELQAAGAAAGTISSVAFNVQGLNGCGALGRLEISIGTTPLTELGNQPVEGLVNVFQVLDYQPLVGWNTHVFSEPWVWDGSSNLVLQVLNRNNPLSANASVYYSSTAPYFRASTIHHGLFDNLLFTNRPNLRFDLDIAETVLQLPAEEHFNGTDYPAGWTSDPAPGSWDQCWYISATDHAGGDPNEVRFHFNETSTNRFITPKVALGGSSFLKLGFRHFLQDDPDGFPVIIKLQYSSDLINWTNAGWQTGSGSRNITEEVQMVITGLSQPYIYLAWTILLPNYWWEGNWYLDDVRLSLPLAHDVAPMAITGLPGITDEAVYPSLRVANLGQNPESFQVLVRGTMRYLHYIQVSNLAPGEQRLMELPPYQPQLGGTNIIQANTLLDGDQDISNDEYIGSFACLDLQGRTAYSFAGNAWMQTGLATFPLSRPSFLALVTPGENIYYLPAAEWIGSDIYAVEIWSTQDRLVKINPQTAQYVYLGNTGNLDFTGLAYDPAQDILYAANTQNLYSIDPQNGAVLATIGAFNVPGISMQAIALCHSTGYLYGIDNAHDALYRINTGTGAATLIGPLGIDLYLQQDISFDQEHSDLFLTGRTVMEEYALYWIDTQTGHAYKGGEFDPQWHLFGFAFPPADPEPPVAHINVDGTLSWSVVQGATHYKIYGSSDPQTGFILLDQTANTTWTDPAFPVEKRFYRVTSATGSF